MKQDQTIMQWVTLLPEAGQSILMKREAIVKLVNDVLTLQSQAADLRISAYFDSLALERAIRSHWNDEQIDYGKQRAE